MAGFTRFHFAWCPLHRAFRRVYSFRFLFHRKPVRLPHPSFVVFLL
jgi:hypothetical protein